MNKPTQQKKSLTKEESDRRNKTDAPRNWGVFPRTTS